MKPEGKPMWTQGNYRRVFLDMHIDDWNETFLSRVDPGRIVAAVRDSVAQCLVVKAKPHTGLCYWPCSVGRMHRGLRGRDYVGEMTELCHENGLAAQVYYSQIFDNWAYDNHPAWRCVYADGLSSREKEHHFFRKGRYGVVCPNNGEYRQYVRANLQELNRNYRFDGMFLDMPFWPEVCYCHACRERYLREAGRELPRTVDWSSKEWLEFQAARERWMGEFAAFSTACVKEINPDVTVEHNFAVAMFPWQFATTELVMDACDYAGGDYYGGYLQQTFACKYYRSASPTLPFVYITSRCDPDLLHHTSTKTYEEFLQHAVTALVHDGAFSVCDGMNPDGSVNEGVYGGVLKRVFGQMKPLERYIGGEPLTSAAIWFPTFSKYDGADAGGPVKDQSLDVEGFARSKLCMASVLREGHLPFDVVSGRGLACLKANALIISDVANIRDGEMDLIERYVRGGGKLYLSGRVGHRRLFELMEADDAGCTADHAVTYLRPTQAGAPFFEGFDQENPMTVNGMQRILRFRGDRDVLATLTLPYTPTSGARFASIHSDPPGVNTPEEAVVRKAVGKGSILWAAAPIETSRPYMSRMAVLSLVRSLCGEPPFTACAPEWVELVAWRKGGATYLAAVNQQERMPLSPVCGVIIDLPRPVHSATLLNTGETLPVEQSDGGSRLVLPPFTVLSMVRLEA